VSKPTRPGAKIAKSPQAKSKDARLARLLPLYAAGIPHAQIARLTGTSLRTVQRYATEPEVQETLEALHAEAQASTVQALAAAREVAVGALLDVLSNSSSPDARVKAAVAILDRSGHGPTSKQELTGKDGGPIQLEGRQQPMTVEQARARYAELTARLVEQGIIPPTALPPSQV